MEIFVKATAGILISAVLCLSLAKQGKDIALLLSVAVCCMVIGAAITYFSPVIEFIERLQMIGNLNEGMLKILLKAVGIGLIAEMTTLICSDANNAALGKALQILATAAILWLSIPLLTQLMDLLEKILGAI